MLSRLLARLPFFRQQPKDTSRPLGYDLLGDLQHDLDPDLLPPARQQVAHASLLESLRALDSQLSVPTVVIASVNQADAARPTIAGLIIQSHLRGLRLALGKLVPGQGFRALRRRVPRTVPGEETRVAVTDSANDDMAIELVGAPAIDDLHNWYERASKGCDLLLIEAPPMLKSVDAALLARGCDGLVLVVESLQTRQEDLEVAVEKATAAGSRPIGLVIDHHREWLPRFIRKLLPAYPRSVRSLRRP